MHLRSSQHVPTALGCLHRDMAGDSSPLDPDASPTPNASALAPPPREEALQRMPPVLLFPQVCHDAQVVVAPLNLCRRHLLLGARARTGTMRDLAAPVLQAGQRVGRPRARVGHVPGQLACGGGAVGGLMVGQWMEEEQRMQSHQWKTGSRGQNSVTRTV